tara:strand:- start:1228 stop:1509 length:282 start_codon:yes stop_codon:yes gene_type:complete
MENINIENIPMVRITWLDAKDMETGWLPIKDILNAPLAVCQEVGYMVVNNDDKIVIMRSWCVDKDDNHGGGAVAIPRGWVRKIEYLKVEYATQ